MNSIFHSFANEQKPTWRHQQITESNEDAVDDENYYYYLKVKLLENPKLLVVIIIHHLRSSILRLLPQFLLQEYSLSIPNQQHILFVPSCTSQTALILKNSGKQKKFFVRENIDWICILTVWLFLNEKTFYGKYFFTSLILIDDQRIWKIFFVF